MSRKIEIISSFTAHMAFVISLVLDHFRRETEGGLHALFSIGSGLLILTTFIYFIMRPRSFFFLSEHTSSQVNEKFRSQSWKIIAFVISWLYVGVGSVGWLMFAQELPRPIASYILMFGIVTIDLLSKNLFLRTKPA